MVKKSQWKTGILLKMDTVKMTHPTLVNLEILNSLRGNFYYEETVTLKVIVEES